MEKKISKSDIDNAICGLDIYEKYGWTAFGEDYQKLKDCIVAGGVNLEDKIKECMKHNLELSTQSTILDKNSYYLPSIVYMVELEIGLNWLLWALNDMLEQKTNLILGLSSDDINKMYSIVEKYYFKQQKYCWKQCDNNPEFGSFHFTMTD